MTDVTEILVHWHAGRSLSEIAVSLGVDRKTIRKYIAPAVEAGMVPGDEPRTAADWRALVETWFPHLLDARLRQVTWPAFDAHRDYVVAQLKEGVTQATIHQRLRDERGVAGSVASFRRWLAATVPEEVLAAKVTVLGPPAVAGDAGQIDYGLLGTWTDPGSGKRHRVWAFVMILAFSRLMFVRPVIRMDQQAWTEAHVAAFEFFDGVPARLVPDNLKTGVEKADLYDPLINRSYADLAAHYNVLIDPARAVKPKDKPRVERPMPYVRDSFWRGREFTSLAQMQAAALTWCMEVAGTRAHRGLDGASPISVFKAAELDLLRPLPARPFELARWSTAKVSPDIHIKVGRTLYSVPWRLIGQRVQVRSTAKTVQIFTDKTQELIATHVTSPAGKVTDFAHYPPEKIAFNMRTPVWCRTQAKVMGPAVEAVITEMLAVNALYRLRSAQGVIRLADKYGPERLDAACALAIDAGDPSYRTIKGILAAGRDETWPRHLEPAGAGDGGAPAHLHGPASLFAPAFPLPDGAATTTRSASEHRHPHHDDGEVPRRPAGDGERPRLTVVPTTPDPVIDRIA